MKHLLLIIIKSYWLIIPESRRSKCIFKESCSNHVFKKTRTKGLFSGLKALRFRYQNCRPGYCLIPAGNEMILITRQQNVFAQEEIDPRLLNKLS